MKRTWIKSGTIVTASDIYVADIWIEDGKIQEIAKDLSHRAVEADDIFDAMGKYVFPGMIDEHTHLESTFNFSETAPWRTETVAAAYGGTTCVIDFSIQGKGETLHDALNTWKARASGSSAIDYGFHVAISDMNASILEEIPKLVESGVPTLKLFMAYKNELMINDSTLFLTLQKAKECGALVMVHAENGDLVDALREQYMSRGNSEPYYHALSRPVSVEAEATSRAIAIAETANAPIFIVHVTAEESAEHIRTAKTKNLKVYGETCPHYLLLTVDCLKLPEFEGAKYVCSPPLRKAKDHDALWHALGDHTIEAIGSDHCAFNFQGQKEMGRGDFRRIPNGGNGLEHRLTLLYTYGVKAGKLSLQRMVQLLSTTPAKIHGLYPQKGTIAIGSDADLVIYEPRGTNKITHATSHQGIDHDMFEGFEIEGGVEQVWLRGKKIISDGVYCGQLSDGTYTKRAPYGACYTGL